MPVEVTFSFTGYAALAAICGFGAVYRKYVKHSHLRPSWDIEIELPKNDVQPVEEPEEDLDPTILKETIRREMTKMLQQHCPAEQERLRTLIAETIRATFAEGTTKDAEWRGRVSQRLENGNDNFATLSKRIDRLDEEFDKKIEGLRSLIIERTNHKQ